MTVTTAPSARRAERAVFWLAFRELRRGGTIVAIALALALWGLISAYDSTRGALLEGLEKLVSNPAIRALYGQPFDLTTAGGFVVWRGGLILGSLAGLWATLCATRLLRGEEDTGRNELVLTGGLTRPELLGTNAVAIGGMCATWVVVVALTLTTTGEPAAGSWLFGAGVGLVGATFSGVGAVSAQLFGARRRATGVAALALGAAYIARMVADSTYAVRWMRWASPLGWLEELRPFAGNHVGPLLLLLLAAVLLWSIAAALGGRRDVGTGLVLDRDVAEPRPALLRSALGFAWRERETGLVGWSAGLAVYGFVIGTITGAFTDFIASSSSFQETVSNFGFKDLASTTGFIAAMDGLIGMIVALYVITSLHVLWEDEEAGRLELAYATPMTRWRWTGATIGVTAACAAIVALTSAVATWIGAEAGHAHVAVVDVLIGIANTLPVVALFGAFALFLAGTRPRMMVPLATGALVGSYLLSFLGSALDLPDWALDLSAFHHLSLAPAEPVAWTATICMLAVAFILGAAGLACYARRDLTS